MRVLAAAQLNSMLSTDTNAGTLNNATSDNSTYVHRRPYGAPRATRRCGAPLRHMAPCPGWARGHVTYVLYVMRNTKKRSAEIGDGIAS
jgi:hypothetical protein